LFGWVSLSERSLSSKNQDVEEGHRGDVETQSTSSHLHRLLRFVRVHRFGKGVVIILRVDDGNLLLHFIEILFLLVAFVVTVFPTGPLWVDLGNLPLHFTWSNKNGDPRVFVTLYLNDRFTGVYFTYCNSRLRLSFSDTEVLAALDVALAFPIKTQKEKMFFHEGLCQMHLRLVGATTIKTVYHVFKTLIASAIGLLARAFSTAAPDYDCFLQI
jgi:hypothetical protein